MLRVPILEKVYQYLLISLAFLSPLTVAGANLTILIIVLLWFFSGNYSNKFNQIISSKIMIASIIFFCMHIIGLIWTEDMNWGLHVLRKMWYFFLLLPILFTIVRKEYIKHYLIAFLSAIFLIVLTTIIIYFELLNEFLLAKITVSKNTNPFMSHISYNPILAFSIYLVLYELFFNKANKKIVIFLLSFVTILMIISMFITGGRAGQIIFFVMISTLIFQYFKHQTIKSLLLISILLPSIFITAYQTSNVFNDRVKTTINSVINYKEIKQTSLGERFMFYQNSLKIIQENPIIGVGTGDLPTEYMKINVIESPTMPNIDNPHNMYLVILVQLGILGLLSMLSIFYLQIKKSLHSPNGFSRDVGIALPIMYIIIMFSDSYLLGHFTTLIFVFFSSFLYKDFEKS